MNNELREKRMQFAATNELSLRSYNAVLGLTVLWGVIINIIMATALKSTILSLHPGLILGVYLVGTLGCSLLLHLTHNSVISVAAFSVMAASMGLLLTYFVSYYDAGDILYAFIVTGIITLCMIGLAMLYPGFFRSIGLGLGIGLIFALIATLICHLVLKASVGILTYGIIILFAGFIGFDWARAQVYPKNIPNAIACASDIYVDMINIFIRILSLVGNRDN